VTSWTEDTGSDVLGEFTVNANEVCYTGTRTIDVLVQASATLQYTSGTDSNLTARLSLGTNTTGLIDEGSQFGDEAKAYSGNGWDVGHLTVSATTNLAPGDCVGLLLETDKVGGTFGMTARQAVISITEQH
jgi:hypothetical protein